VHFQRQWVHVDVVGIFTCAPWATLDPGRVWLALQAAEVPQIAGVLDANEEVAVAMHPGCCVSWMHGDANKMEWLRVGHATRRLAQLLFS
jgi:hypothetical protein